MSWFDPTCWKLPSAMNRSLTCFLVVIVKLLTIPNSVVDSVSDDVERFVAIKIISRCLALVGEKSFLKNF